MDAVTVNHAAKSLEQLISQVISNVEPTIICNDKGEKALLMSMDEFNSWQETLYLLSNPANAKHLQESITQAKAGKVQEKELIEP